MTLSRELSSLLHLPLASIRILLIESSLMLSSLKTIKCQISDWPRLSTFLRHHGCFRCSIRASLVIRLWLTKVHPVWLSKYWHGSNAYDLSYFAVFFYRLSIWRECQVQSLITSCSAQVVTLALSLPSYQWVLRSGKLIGVTFLDKHASSMRFFVL